MPFEGNISLKNLLNIIEKAVYPMQRIEKIVIDLLKLYILFYWDEGFNFIRPLEKLRSNWEKLNTGLFSDEWFSNLEESLSDRDKFLRAIEANKQNKKIKNLHVSDTSEQNSKGKKNNVSSLYSEISVFDCLLVPNG